MGKQIEIFFGFANVVVQFLLSILGIKKRERNKIQRRKPNKIKWNAKQVSRN